MLRYFGFELVTMHRSGFGKEREYRNKKKKKMKDIKTSFLNSCAQQ